MRLPLPALSALLLAPCLLSAQAADVDLVLPEGFSARVLARGLGAARHVVVSDNGDVYISLQSGQGGLVALRDADCDNAWETVERFGNGQGTALALHGGYLYHQSGSNIVRWRLPTDGALVPTEGPETVVSGFAPQQEHQAKGITFDGQGRLYVTIGAPSNSCQVENRQALSPGKQPCEELERHAGVWRFPNGEPGQIQWRVSTSPPACAIPSPSTGTPTPVRSGSSPTGATCSTRAGTASTATKRTPNCRPRRCTSWSKASMPAGLTPTGTPSTACAASPEYGGNGELTAREGLYADPVVAFPAHWAPNDMIIYRGTNFPKRYRTGAFVAFHGSWNRAPLPQQGYNVVFVPMDTQGNVTGPFEVFASNFSGSNGAPITQPLQRQAAPLRRGRRPRRQSLHRRRQSRLPLADPP
jgi:hypothetical protein